MLVFQEEGNQETTLRARHIWQASLCCREEVIAFCFLNKPYWGIWLHVHVIRWQLSRWLKGICPLTRKLCKSTSMQPFLSIVKLNCTCLNVPCMLVLQVCFPRCKEHGESHCFSWLWPQHTDLHWLCCYYRWATCEGKHAEVHELCFILFKISFLSFHLYVNIQLALCYKNSIK